MDAPTDPRPILRRRPYFAPEVEAKWREAWAREAAFEPGPAGQEDTFVYACTPFTTGKAHMGHVRSYTLADVCARRARAEGRSVLWAMGFDAFGLPNEMAAIAHEIAPAGWVEACRRRMTEQFQRLGLSTDPTRTFVTSHPDYYRWTQWAFLRLLERNLVYRADGVENWCEGCGCVLAALQVGEDGSCWRCGGDVGLACIPQWYMRITPYAEELHAGLDALTGWDENAVAYQRALLGRVDGYELEISAPSEEVLTVFAPSMAYVEKATFIALSPNHPRLDRLISRRGAAQDIEAQRRRSLGRAERSDAAVPATNSGLWARVPGRDEPLPIVVTPSVDLRYGGGAALGAPACDPADASIARQLGFSTPPPERPAPALRPAVRFRLRDSSISRQRTWGAPIPIVHCPDCGVVPVPDADLPVVLPEDLAPTGRGSALADHPDFKTCDCPRCGAAARRETDTLDVHVDSLWMLAPFCVPADARDTQMFTHPDLARWLPVSQVVCGADQAAWWVNDRFFFKVLRDIGLLPHLSDGEPVRRLLMHEMVLAGGRKMSKSLGNVVDPDEVIDRWGADTVRLSVLKVNPRKAFSWSDESLRENHAFLTALWDFVHEIIEAGEPANLDPAGQRRLGRWLETAARKTAEAYDHRAFHVVQRELKVFFQLIRRHGRAYGAGACRPATAQLVGWLAPLAPHIAAELEARLAEAAHPRSEPAPAPRQPEPA